MEGGLEVLLNWKSRVFTQYTQILGSVLCITVLSMGAERAHWVKVHTAHAEDLSSVPRAHVKLPYLLAN